MTRLRDSPKMFCRKNGYWSEHPDFPRGDWKLEVANGDTLQSYWEWAQSQYEIEQDV